MDGFDGQRLTVGPESAGSEPQTAVLLFIGCIACPSDLLILWSRRSRRAAEVKGEAYPNCKHGTKDRTPYVRLAVEVLARFGWVEAHIRSAVQSR